jgi:hypothetical protein
MDDQRVHPDRALRSLLRQRHYAFRAIDVQFRMPTYLKERDLMNVAKLLTYDPGSTLPIARLC